MNNIKDTNDINIRQTSIFSIRAMIHSDLPGVSPIYAAPILPQIPLHSHCIERFIRAIRDIGMKKSLAMLMRLPGENLWRDPAAVLA